MKAQAERRQTLVLGVYAREFPGGLLKLDPAFAIDRILLITVYVNAEEGYTTQAKIADHASEYFCEELGEGGIGSRAAVGVASLPGNAPVEISIIAAVGK